MKIKKFLLTVLVLAIVCLPVAAQYSDAVSGSSVIRLSLEDAQKRALSHNNDLRNASIQIREAEMQKWQSIASMLPQANASFQYVNMCGYQMDLMGRSIAMPPYGTLGVQTSIAVNGQMILAVLLQDLAEDMKNITYEQSRHNLNINVMQSYLSVLVMEDIVNLLDSSLSNLNDLAAMTKKSVEVGVAEPTAADQILVRVATIQNAINSNKRSVEMAYNSLRLMLDIPSDVDIELTESLTELLSADNIIKMLGIDFDINRNYDYQLLVKNTELAKKNLILSTMSYTPTLSASYQYTGRKYFSDEQTMNMQAPNMVAISLSIPLFTAGKNGAAIQEKKLAYERALNTLDYTRDALGVQNKQLRFNLTNAYETYQNEVYNIEVTKRVFKSASNKYQYGVASSLELTNASNDLITAENSYVKAVLDLVNAQVAYMKFLNQD